MCNKINFLILDDEDSFLKIYPSIFKEYENFKYCFINIKIGNFTLRILKDSNIY